MPGARVWWLSRVSDAGATRGARSLENVVPQAIDWDLKLS